MIFENATLITMNPRREIITNAALAVEGDRIAAVGKTREIVARIGDAARMGNALGEQTQATTASVEVPGMKSW